MAKSNHELIQEFFSCNPDEEDALIQSMIPGSLEIKLYKVQNLSWKREHDAALAKAETKKPLKSSPVSFSIPTFAALPLTIFGLVFTILGALYVLPLIAGGIFALVLALLIVVINEYEPFWNWVTDAENNYKQALDEAKELDPINILTEKLTKLVKCGKFNLLDFPYCTKFDLLDFQEGFDENLYHDKIPITVIRSILSLIDAINRHTIEGSWQAQPEIQMQYHGVVYICNLENTRRLESELVTNFHYNQGLTFFSAPPSEFISDIIKIIFDTWSGLVRYKSSVYNYSISDFLVDKLKNLDYIQNPNESRFEEENSEGTRLLI
ncbi:MAG: hypothetical protein H0T84_01645 [Tatlockia sp.]|nr:hypothetical protein [Tatlockia sp.]